MTTGRPAARLGCGCRRSTTKTHGHRPQCHLYDVDREDGHRARQRFLRRIATREARTP